MRFSSATTKKLMAKTKVKSHLVSVPVDPSHADFEAAAKKLSMSPESLQQIIDLTQLICEESTGRNLSPSQIVSACLNVVTEVIREGCDPRTHADMCSSIFQQLWAGVGLSSDHSPKEQ